MKNRTSPHRFRRAAARHLLGISLLAVVSAAVARAQATAASSASGEDPIVLSPFTVGAGDNSGYQATSTLAGTRLKTDLRDLGSAISVMTPEFLEDIGATNAATALSYGLNLEVAGTQGNYANSAFLNGRSVQDEQRTEPQGGQRVRGLASASLTRGYFLTDIPFDGYNTSRVTINRGPNSLLFGIGSPGGIIENTPSRPSLSRDFGSVSFRVGERSSHRETFDFNKQVIPRRLALRVSSVYDQNNYQQRPAFELDRRIYGALDGVLFENERSPILGPTILRAGYEQGSIYGTPSSVTPPGDAITDWFYPPDPALQQVTGMPFPAFAIWATDGTFRPKFTRNSSILPTQPSIRGASTPSVFNRIALTYNQPRSHTPSIGIPGSSLQGGQAAIPYVLATDGRSPISHSTVFPFFGQMPGFIAPVIMDRAIFDNEHHLLSGNVDRVERRFSARNLTLEQSLLKGRAGIELVYDEQRYDNWNQLAFAGAGGGSTAVSNYDVSIDIEEFLSNGQPNPNVGRPLIKTLGFGDFSERRTEREAYRATAFYELDFAGDRGWKQWIGRHIFTAFGNRQKIDRLAKNYLAVWDSDSVARSTIVDVPLNNGNRRVFGVVYVGDSLLGLNIQSPADVRIVDSIDVRVPQPGDRHTAFHFNTATRRVENGEFFVRNILNNGNLSRQTINSEALSWQSYFLKGHLVGLYGWRRDTTKTYERVGNARLPTGEWDPANLALMSTPSLDAEGESISWSVVGRVPERFSRRLFGSELSGHYNESDNFQPISVRRTILGETIDPPSGQTREYGFTVELLERRLSMRFNWFKTESAGVTAPNIGTAIQITDRIGTWLNWWKDAEQASVPISEALTRVGGASAAGTFASYPAVYSAIIGLMPEEAQRAIDFQFAPDGTLDSNPVLGRAATTSFVARGFEVDVAGNLTPNWRVAFNLGKQETIQSDTAPVLARVALAVNENLARSPLNTFRDNPQSTDIVTFRQRFNQVVLAPLTATLAQDGAVSLEQRKWRANFTTNYSFGKETFLRGFAIGTGFRWQDRAAIGYALIPNASVVQPDLGRPYFGKEQFNGDAWLSYSRTFKNGRKWKVQLNVRNAFGDHGWIPVVMNPHGELAVVRNPNPREFFLTNTVSF